MKGAPETSNAALAFGSRCCFHGASCRLLLGPCSQCSPYSTAQLKEASNRHGRRKVFAMPERGCVQVEPVVGPRAPILPTGASTAAARGLTYLAIYCGPRLLICEGVVIRATGRSVVVAGRARNGWDLLRVLHRQRFHL